MFQKNSGESWLIVGLGNPGREYEKTRHNAGFRCLDKIAEELNVKVDKLKYQGLYCQTGYKGKKLFLLKPQTYMNLSGDSIGQLARFYKIKPEEVLVVHDELELPPGTVSLKNGGGLGGHNGLRSTKAVLGTADFWRLRFGIGRPEHKDVAGYVLSDFTSDEKIILSQIFPSAATLLEKVLSGDPVKLLPEWNKKKLLADT